MLTQEQLNHFDTFGFIVWRQAFSPDEIATIIAQFEEVLAEDRQGQGFAGDKRQGVHGFLELREDLSKLLEDDRIYVSIEQLLGSGFVWIGSDGNLYVGDTRWHPDNSASYRRVKVAFYLDPVGAHTGCLRVIPGSHLPGMGDQLRELWPIDETGECPFGISGPRSPSSHSSRSPVTWSSSTSASFIPRMGVGPVVACSPSTLGPSRPVSPTTISCAGPMSSTSKTSMRWATRSATAYTRTLSCTRAHPGSSRWSANWSNWASDERCRSVCHFPGPRCSYDQDRRRRSTSSRIKTLD